MHFLILFVLLMSFLSFRKIICVDFISTVLAKGSVYLSFGSVNTPEHGRQQDLHRAIYVDIPLSPL